MPGGTGVDKFGKRFPKRTFGVGIAEQYIIKNTLIYVHSIRNHNDISAHH